MVFVWGCGWHWGVRGGSRVEYGVAVKGAWIRTGDDAMTWWVSSLSFISDCIV